MKECNVCYNLVKKPVLCFSSCKFQLCYSCFKKLLELNDGEVVFTCPMCRVPHVYHKSAKFTKFVNKSRDLLKKIVDLTYIQSRTDIAWCRSIYQEFPLFEAYLERNSELLVYNDVS